MFFTLTMSHFSKEREEEDYRHRLHQKVLEDKRDFLCYKGRINPRHHYPYLRSKGILNLEICSEIDHIVGPTARASRFIDELQRNGGTRALPCFLESLRRDGTQIYILKRLNETLEQLQHEPPPSLALNHNGDGLQPHRGREVEESSTVSIKEGQASSLCDAGPTALFHGSEMPLRLPSLKKLAKCTPSLEREPTAETKLTPHSTGDQE